MSLKDKLKSISQKTVRAVALTASLGAGIAATEAKAETSQETSTDNNAPIVHVETNTVAQEKSEETPRYLSANYPRHNKNSVLLDAMHMLFYLDLAKTDPETSEVAENFTFNDVLDAKKYCDNLSVTPQEIIDPKNTPYTEYEQGIINDAVDYLSNGVDVKGGKEGVKNRIYQVLEASGNPKISYTKDENSFTANVLGHECSNYSPGGRGHIYINEAKDFVAEVSHAYRHQNNLVGERGNFVMDGLKDILTFNSAGFTKKAQNQNYKEVGSMEYDTHSIVEPVLTEYIVQSPMGLYSMFPNSPGVATLSEAFAMIDMLRHQQNDWSAVYTWTSEGDDAVEKGKESLRNRLLGAIAGNDEYMAKKAEQEGIKETEPLLKGIVLNDNDENNMSPPKSQKISPAVASAVKNKYSNS